MMLFTRLISRRAAPWAQDPDGPRGYFAGEQDPDEDAGVGLLTINGAPGGRRIEVWHKPIQFGPALTIVATTFSAADGTWQVPDVPAAEWYRLIAVDYAGVYESVIVDDVQPYVPA